MAVVGIVVVVEVAAEAQLAEEKAIQNADFLLDVGVVRHAALQAHHQLVDLGQRALQIEIGIGVLRKRQRRLGERQTVVFGDQRAEIVENPRRRDHFTRLLKYAYLKPISQSIPKYSAANRTRHAASNTMRVERLAMQADPVEADGKPVHHAREHEARADHLHEENQPAARRHIDAAPAQADEQQQRVHASAEPDAQGQTRMREDRHEDEVAQLRDDQHADADLHRRLDVLLRIEAGREDLDEDQPDQADAVGRQRAADHHDRVAVEFAVVEQRCRKRLGEEKQRDRARRRQQERDAQTPVEQRRILVRIGVDVRLREARQQDRAERDAQQRGRETPSAGRRS